MPDASRGRSLYAATVVRVFVLGSGSSGNAAVVEACGERLMIDAGVGPRGAAARMRALGTDLFPRGVLGIVVTHQHGDHLAQAEPLALALRAPLFMHGGIAAERVRTRFDVRPYAPGTTLCIGPFEVESVAVPHDAPQVAISVAAEGKRFAIVTDLGHVPPGLAAFVGRCDGALVEANHCRQLLRIGPYPERLKRRVEGSYGHLANEQTADLAAELSGSRLAHLWLGHISRVNNTKERALEVVRARSRGLAVDAVSHGAPCVLDVTTFPTQLPLLL
jgi:phosphoribosyl 1,2-cyclic phosphodiesterase